MILLLVILFLCSGIVGAFFILALIRTITLILGAPFVPSSDNKLETITNFVQIKKGKKIVDLGSGDGKIVIALGIKGVTVDGYEINPFLVWQAKRKIKKLHLEKNVHIFWKSFWKVNLKQYDVVIVYGITYIMKRLEEKLRNELPKGSIVISNYFQFPTWKPVKEENEIRVYKR